MIQKRFNGLLSVAVGVMLIAAGVSGCSGGALTTREKAAGIGALGGAAAGGLVGAAVGHPGAGAAIGGGLGLGAGALIGDHLQGLEQQQYQNQRQVQQNQYEIERQRQEAERLRRQQEY
jgi:phage tail tape-measure protein